MGSRSQDAAGGQGLEGIEATGQGQASGILPTGLLPERTTILVLGVDDLTAEPPLLVAVWFVSCETGGGGCILIGVPTDMWVDESLGITVGGYFSATWNGDPDSGLKEQLYSIMPLEVNATVVMDEVFFGALLEYINGAPVGEGNLSAEDIILVSRLLRESPNLETGFQAEILRSISTALSSDVLYSDITSLMVRLPEHARLSVPTARLALLVSQAFPDDPAGSCVKVIGTDGEIPRGCLGR